jgi:small subunit ribosomal protein S2
MAAEVGIRELLEAGVHFGHQTRRWNPKMRRFIWGERGGIYIIDLLQTERLLRQAREFCYDLSSRGGTVLFVGTKKQARDSVKTVAEACGMPHINHRWLGGLLTNFQTINQRIKRLHDLERYEADGQLALLPTRERLAAEADLAKLRANLGGVKNMTRTPDAIFVIDLKTETIGVREAQRLRIPLIGLVDTNCDPDGIDFVIPGNDDAIRSCDLIARALGDVIAEGSSQWRQVEDERVQREAAAQAARAAEEQQRREAEEAARRQAAADARAAEEAAATAQVNPRDNATEIAKRKDGEQKPARPAQDTTPDPASKIETPVTDAVLGPDETAIEEEAAKTPVEAVQPAETAGERGAPEPGPAGAHSAKPGE